MIFLSIISSLLLSDIRTTLISLIVGFLVFKLTKFYVLVFSLPPGPIPLPFLGNYLNLHGSKQYLSVELEEWTKKYGKLMTLWIGNSPQVLVSDVDLGREALRKNELAGRPMFQTVQSLSINNKRNDVLFTDYNHTWEALRRVCHATVQKFSATEKLNDVVVDCVDTTLGKMIEREGLDKPFVPFNYIYHIFINILASNTFNIRYDFDDPEYQLIRYIQNEYVTEVFSRQAYWSMIPGFRHFDPEYYKLRKTFVKYLNITIDRFESHYKDYDESAIRDFCDALIQAKNEAIANSKESAPYLTDDNLAMAIFDLLSAGTDTSQRTFQWALLHMLYDKDIEKKLREEIASVVGDRIPTHEDRSRCHYTMAFMTEVLRDNNILPVSLPHRAVVRTKLGDYTIPEDTQVALFQSAILHQEEHFKDPYEFRPERFLDSDGKFISARHKAFVSFGVGRRLCLGEKLAIADIFLVLVRFLQKTSDYDISLHMNETTDPLLPNPKLIDHRPKPFKISMHKK